MRCTPPPPAPSAPAAGVRLGRLLIASLLGGALVMACTPPPPVLPDEPDEEDTEPDAEKKDIKIDTGLGGFDTGKKKDAGKDAGKPKTDTGKKDGGTTKDTAADVVADTADTSTTDGGGGDSEGDVEGDAGDDGGDAESPDVAVISCTADAKLCDGNKAVVCNAAGDGYKAGGTDCGPGVCDKGECKADQACPKDAQKCVGKVGWKCADDLSEWEEFLPCAKTQVCQMIDFDGDKLASCVDLACVPSKDTCSGKYDSATHSTAGDVVVKCTKDGTKKYPTSTGKDCTKDGKVCVLDAKGIGACALPKCGDGKVNKAGKEECDLGTDPATGISKNGAPGTKCTKDCKSIDDSCKTNADCSKLKLGQCDVAWVCNKKDQVCEALPKLADPCDDNNPCTVDDLCIDGACLGYDAPCQDDNPCTIDTCDILTGCKHNDAVNVACDDGEDCTVGDSCAGGTCKGGENACDCDEKDPKSCNKFDDGDLCNGTLACKAGSCVVAEGTAVTCGKGVCISTKEKSALACEKAGKIWIPGTKKCHDPLTKSPVKNAGACEKAKGTWQENNACRKSMCFASSGACEMKLKVSGTPCVDGNACTKADQCWGGLCDGDLISCDDKNPCTVDVCHKKKGCLFAPATLPLGKKKPCDDGDACTNPGGLDACEDGQCVGVNSCECKNDGDCAGKGLNKCTGTYKCDLVANKCKVDPKTLVVCNENAEGPCAVNACDDATGKCKITWKNEGALCDDGNACSLEDKCAPGGKKLTCKGKKNGCNDGNFCTTDACHPKFGCTNFNNSNPCNDDNPCTTDDKCVDGKCWPGANKCQCFTDKECAYLNIGNLCQGTYKCNQDINQCHFDPASIIKCGAGVCNSPAKTNKFDCEAANGGIWTPDNDCAFTFCDGKKGKCVQKWLKNEVTCNDANPCTTPDICTDGKCATKDKVCNDFNACTDDSCDPFKPSGCVFDAKAMDGKPCDDGDVCNAEGGCKGGTCEPGKGVKDCNDGNSCTFDGCDAKLGCFHQALKGEQCNDGDYCTGSGTGKGIKLIKDKSDHKLDLCDDKGMCQSGDKFTCNDGNACTKETCKPGGFIAPLPGAATKSCEFVYLSAEVTCISGNKCKTGSVCNGGGGCSDDKAKDVNCDDGNVCTTDSCAVLEGCKTKGNNKPCDDGNACSIEDTCAFSKDKPHLGTCFSLKSLDCNDENLCTKDSCDPKTGCKHEVDPAASSCGDFAACTKPPDPYCEFKGIQHLMISEIYVGDPDDHSDDFIEIYNPSQKKPKLGDYVLQWRPKESKEVADWKLLIKLPAVTLHDYGYLLVGNIGPLPGGIQADATDIKNFKLIASGMQVRIFDKPHTLSHDVVTWGVGKEVVSPEGQPLKPWFSANSVERKATKTSTAKTMAEGGLEWYAGNAVDNNNNSGDFVVRLTPEPQGLSLGKIYEPACKGKCSTQKVCDYKGAGADACVLDKTCAVGCGSGKTCQSGFGICVADFKEKVVISEVGFGVKGKAGAEFVELWNAGKKPIDITGFVLQFKPAASGGPDPWKFVVQVPAKTMLLPNRFYVLGSQSWAGQRGSVDVVFKDSAMGLDPAGGSLHLYDPRTQVELDKVGWGTTKEYKSGAFKGGTIDPGMTLVRKAKPGSTGSSMAPGGAEFLAGHSVDTDSPIKDFVLVAKAGPWSNRSGAFAPACGGGCSSPAVCNFAGPSGACVDPTCGGKCKAGAVCNIKTGKCDKTVLISQYSIIGPPAKYKAGIAYKNLPQKENEWVEVYNPGHAPVSILGMLLQVKFFGVGGWKTRTLPFEDACRFYDVKTKTITKQACGGPGEPCRCQNDLERDADGGYKLDASGKPSPRPCIADQQCQSGVIPPKKYVLVAGPKYDVNLPIPTWVAESIFDWGFDPSGGGLRLVRGDGSKFANNKQEADKVGWGLPGGAQFCGPQPLPKPNAKEAHCVFMRKPWKEATADQMADPMHPAYYGGNGYKTDSLDGSKDCQTNWVWVCPRKPRNLVHRPQQP